VPLKNSIVKYICYKVDEMISTYRVDVIFQYFAIYFNKIMEGTLYISKAIGEVILVLFPGE